MSEKIKVPESADLLAARIYLRPLKGERLQHRIPDWLGSAAQELFLRAAGLDGAELGALHDDNGRQRPYTASTLQPISLIKDRVWRMEKEYFLRFTTLNRKTSEALLRAIAPGGLLGEGAEVEFYRCAFRVSHVDLQQRRDAGWLDYNDIQEHYADPRRQVEEFELRFASETAFAIPGASGLSLPLPLASRVFGGLLRKWNRFCPPAARLEALGEKDLEAAVALSAFELRSGLVKFEIDRTAYRETGVRRKGFKGRVIYKIYSDNEELKRAMNILADFTFFAGVGLETTRGMGQAHKHYA